MQVLDGDLEPGFLGQFPSRSNDIVLADTGYTAERHIPQRGVDVLPVGALMHDEAPIASLDEHGDVAVAQVLGLHLGPGDDPLDHPSGPITSTSSSAGDPIS